MCHDFSTISTPKKPTGRNFLPLQNQSAMRNHEKTRQTSLNNQHFHNMRSPVSQQGPWIKPRGMTPVLPGMPTHSTMAPHNQTSTRFANANRRLSPTITNKNRFSPQPANNTYRRRTHSETLPTRSPLWNAPKNLASVSLLASPTQFLNPTPNNALPKLKTVAVPLTCEEVEAQASKRNFRGPLTCNEVELLQASIMTSAHQSVRPRSSSPTPSTSSSGYESISSSLSVTIGDDQSDVSSSPASPMSDSVFCSFDKDPVMQSSPIGKGAPPIPFQQACPILFIKEDIHNTTPSPIFNPDDDGYSSSDSVDKFLPGTQIGNGEDLHAILSSNDESSNSDIPLPSTTEIWLTSVKVVGLPCQFLSSEDNTNNTTIEPVVKPATPNDENTKDKKKTSNSPEKKASISPKKVSNSPEKKASISPEKVSNSLEKVSNSPEKVSNSPAPKAVCGVMPTVCSDPPQAVSLPLPPNVWVIPTTELSLAETKRVDVTGLFTNFLSRANSPVASSNEQTQMSGLMSSCNKVAAGEASILKSKCSEDAALSSLFSSLHIQTSDGAKNAELYRGHSLPTNDCALGMLKQIRHGIHRNFNMMCNSVSQGTAAA